MASEEMTLLEKLALSMTTIRYADHPPAYHQTTAAHIAHMLELATETIRDNQLAVDPTHTRALILVHDLPEIGLQADFSSWQQAHDPQIKVQKKQLEAEAIARLAQQHGQFISALFAEYEAQKSAESRLVRWLDKYEDSLYMMAVFAEFGGNPAWLGHNANRVLQATRHFLPLKPLAERRLHELKPLFAEHQALNDWHDLMQQLAEL